MGEPRYMEPVFVADLVVSGIASIEPLTSGLYRFTFYVEQTSPVDGQPERIIIAKLVGTRETVEASHAMKSAMLAATAAEQPLFGAANKPKRH